MNWLEKQLNNCTPPDIILHTGAGTCRELPLWLQSGAKRIVLVEPNPELLPELRRRVHGQPNVEIVPAALADQNGRGTLHLFNFPLLSSLRQPAGLHHSLPGLRQISRASVELTTVTQLIDKLGIGESTSNWLVIDTPGEEATIIDQLRQSDRLHYFDRIILSAGSEPLYQDAKSAAELLGPLQSSGYVAIGKVDHSDADWSRHHLYLDRRALECKRLKNELNATREELAETKSNGEKQRQELEAQVAKQTNHASRLQEERSQLQAKLSKAEENRDSANHYRKRVAELENDLAGRNANIEAVTRELERAHEETQTISQAKDKALQENDSLSKRIESLTRELADAKDTIEKQQSKIEKSQADLSLALRLQMLRENDLKELQSRYGEVLTINDKQHDLLTQLHHRLSRAAEYLQLVHAQSDDQRLPEDLLEALTGKSSQPD